MKKIISIMLVCMLITTISFAGTFTKSSNGSSISINVDQGKTILLKAREIFGKIFTGWTITGATVTDSSLSEQTITMGSSDVTATANYATPYTITVNQTANGVISPGTVTVAEGSSKTFTITPNTSHEIEDVLVDGVSVLSSCVDGTGDEKTYTMSGINGNKTITAKYSSTGSSGSGSVIIPTISVSSKTTNSITVSTVATDPSGGNLVYKLYVDGTLKATSPATVSGSSVSLTASELNEYTTYELMVTIECNNQVLGTSSSLVVKTMCGGYTGVSEMNCRNNAWSGTSFSSDKQRKKYCYICCSSNITCRSANSSNGSRIYIYTCGGCNTVLHQGDYGDSVGIRAKVHTCKLHSSGKVYMSVIVTDANTSYGDDGIEMSCAFSDHCIHGYLSEHD